MIELCDKKLSLLSLLLCIPPIIWYEELFNYYYLTPCAVIIIFTLLWNFPYIATSLHTKPLYLCDLTGENLNIVIKDEEQRKTFTEIKDKYVLTFNITLAIITSLAGGALFDIWIYKTKNKEDLPEIIGITGGILSMYSKFQTYIGYFLLTIFIKLKKEKEKQLCFEYNSNQENYIVEMKEFKSKENIILGSEKNSIVENQTPNIITEITIEDKKKNLSPVQRRNINN